MGPRIVDRERGVRRGAINNLDELPWRERLDMPVEVAVIAAPGASILCARWISQSHRRQVGAMPCSRYISTATSVKVAWCTPRIVWCVLFVDHDLGRGRDHL